MSDHEPDIAVYVGPTSVGVEDVTPGFSHARVLRLPPIAREDLQMLPECIGTILIVDGYFGNVPSVGHLELLRTLKHRRVFGCSSIGAIRAFELRYDGMVGLGRVYKAFFEFDDLMDDEVALLHAPAPYYWQLSVPLINVRLALQALQAASICCEGMAKTVIDHLKPRYFGERTPEAVMSAANAAGGFDFAEALRDQLFREDAKRSDLASALEHILETVPPPHRHVIV